MTDKERAQIYKDSMPKEPRESFVLQILDWVIWFVSIAAFVVPYIALAIHMMTTAKGTR